MSRKLGWLICGLLLVLPCLCAAYNERAAVIDGVVPYCRLANTLEVYAEPDLAGEPVAMAEKGSLITVLGLGATFQKDGEWQQWREVRYDLTGKPGRGYVYTADYLHNNAFKFDANRFYTYLYDSGDEFVIGGRIYDLTPPEQLAGFQTIELQDHEIYDMASADSSVFTVKSGTGLTNVKLVIDVLIDPEYCSPDYQYYFVWTGEVMLPLFVLLHDTQLDSDISAREPGEDAYLGDWYDEYVLLPGDGLPMDTMLKVLHTADKFDDEGCPLNSQYAVEVYAWNGEQAVLKQQTAKFKDWRKGE